MWALDLFKFVLILLLPMPLGICYFINVLKVSLKHKFCLNTRVREGGGFALFGINDEKQVTKLFVWTDRFVRSA